MIFADSIFALSSGRLPSGVAVIRLSGLHTRSALGAIAGFVPEDRRLALRTFRDSEGREIDRGLVAFFGGPKSVTGEDCAEFHLHGGRAVVTAMMDAIGQIDGFRLAEAGEFTRRAFLAGKIDLTEAEALADLIDAETESQRRLALSNVSGHQSHLYQSWREQILSSRASIEAELDFSDQEDVPGAVPALVWQGLETMAEAIEQHIGQYRRSEMILDGFKVVILGAPNAGKSSLLNALAGGDVAIVTDEPGTTRDVLEAVLELAGVRVRLFDTAGLRSGAGMVEALGIERALAQAEHADLILDVVDLSGPGLRSMSRLEGGGAPRMLIGTKADLIHEVGSDAFDCVVSTVTGMGLAALLAAIESRAVAAVGSLSDPLPTRMRHIEHLSHGLAALRLAIADPAGPLELRADALRRASDSLGRIMGAISSEELLGRIFSTFCVGK